MNASFRIIILLFAILLGELLPALSGYASANAASCTPTPWEEIGPFYRPNAPVRSSIGRGYILRGTVRSAADCSPIERARIEVWQVSPEGKYDDAHRATLFSDRRGRYLLNTSYPPPYGQGRSHIHLVVDAKGYDGVITQHYPVEGTKRANFDLVLLPESKESGKGRNPLGRKMGM